MPSTVNANNLSTVHASSTGITQWFPDVCKTPTPGGPVPIPYPNIAMSSDTADGSTTVKVQGNPIMLKGSNFRMSTGDEAGSAMGVVSNKIKGKAEPVMYSFDVKVDGKNVFRLSDPMTHNGNMANGGGTPVGQPNLPAFPSNGPECDRTKAEKEKQQTVSESGWANSGVVPDHRPKIKAVAGEEGVVLYIRKTKAECQDWIIAKHQPKPHSCMDGTTITGAHVPMVQRWLDEYFRGLTEAEREKESRGPTSPKAQAERYSRSAGDYIGVIGIPVGKGFIRPEKGKGRYQGKWMTGDYDLFELLANGPSCKKITKESGFATVKKKINKRCGLAVIQHPPQAQWVPDAEEMAKGVSEFDMNQKVKESLAAGGSALLKKIKWHPKRKKMSIIDSPLTVVAGDGAVTLDKKKQVRDALVCQDCDK